jgi:hypothetical protein
MPMQPGDIDRTVVLDVDDGGGVLGDCSLLVE